MAQMVFLHLSPSPSSGALLLTPNPQEEYGASGGDPLVSGEKPPQRHPRWPG